MTEEEYKAVTIQQLDILNSINQNLRQLFKTHVIVDGAEHGDGHVVNVDDANVAKQLPAAQIRQVTIFAKKANTASVFIGFGRMTNSQDYAVELAKGESQTFPVSNLNLLYLAGTAGDGISYIAL